MNQYQWIIDALKVSDITSLEKYINNNIQRKDAVLSQLLNVRPWSPSDELLTYLL